MTDSSAILTPDELKPASDLVQKTLEQLDRILLGRKPLHRLVLIGILSKGHVLLEGLPGLGKTALVRTIGQVLRLQFKRIQFTPDLMPGDVLGTHILQETESGRRELVFQPGPVFIHLDPVRGSDQRAAGRRRSRSGVRRPPRAPPGIWPACSRPRSSRKG